MKTRAYKRRQKPLLLAFAALSLAAVSAATVAAAAAADSAAAASEQPHRRDRRWSYEERWSATCESGQRQSPIDIHASIVDVTPMQKMHFVNYVQSGAVKLHNNGHTGRRASEQTSDLSTANLIADYSSYDRF